MSEGPSFILDLWQENSCQKTTQIKQLLVLDIQCHIGGQQSS